jgi:hypothetical protein
MSKEYSDFSKQQEDILDYLNRPENIGKWISPTKIGNAIHPSAISGSSWASPKCLRLVDMGKLERNDKGQYRNWGN